MRLIDADGFYESFEYENCYRCQYFSSSDCEYCNTNDFLVAIDSRPRVDAVQVVRCNDCEYSDNVVHDGHGNEYLVCLQHDCLVSRDEYCSRAKECKRI